MGENKERMILEFLRPIIKLIPELKPPERKLSIQERLMWTSFVVVLFILLAFTYPILVSPDELPSSVYQEMTIIFYPQVVSIIFLGMGPLITSIAILQILLRFKILKLDLTRKKDRELFYGTQKILVILIAFFGASAIVYDLHLGSTFFGTHWSFFEPSVMFIILQLIVGAVILMYLDDIIVKWGLGSGIGLFIAVGVSQEIIVSSLNFFRGYNGEFLGIIPNFLDKFLTGTTDWLGLFPLIMTLLIFLIIIYVIFMRIEIPVHANKTKRKFSLKFFYVSILPISLVAALLMNITLLVRRFTGIDIYNSPPPVEMNTFQHIVYQIASTVTLGNLYKIIPSSLSDLLSGETPRIFDPLIMIHLIAYLLLFIVFSIIFGIFLAWFYGINQKSAIDDLHDLGIKDENIEKDLNYYIPHLILASSFAVGILVVFSGLLGTLGSGVGILITAGVFHRFYEEIKGHKKFCPHCDSEDIEWLLPSLWSLWECRKCGYRGVIVFEE